MSLPKSSSSMRLAIVSSVRGYVWAGSEELWLAAALNALDSGDKVLACLQKDLHSAPALQSFCNKGGDLTSWRITKWPRLDKARALIRQMFSDSKLSNPDVILVSLGSLNDLLYVPGLRKYLSTTSIPFVVLCQFNSDILPFVPSERILVASLLKKSSSIVFVSNQNLRLARRQFADPLQHAEVILNPCRQMLSEPLIYPQLDKTIIFACVARFDVLWKAQDLLLEVLSTSTWLSRDWRLKFFGLGPDLDYVKQYASFLGLASNVEFCGYVRDIKDIWIDSHLLILPSRGEGTPLAVLEAMICGRPVVTTNVGGNSEVIRDGSDGFISPCATVECISDTLEKAWENQFRWQSMGLSARDRVKQLCGSDPSFKLLQILRSSCS